MPDSDPNTGQAVVIDARGLKCPLPVLKTEKQLARSRPGSRIVVLATDPVAKIDIPLVCRTGGHGCTISSGLEGLRFEIVVGGASGV